GTAWQGEGRRHDADDCRRPVIEDEGLPQRVFTPIEEAVPERIGNEGDRCGTLTILFSREGASLDGKDAPDREEARRDRGDGQPWGIPAAGQIDDVVARGRDRVERMRARLPLEETSGRQREFREPRRSRVTNDGEPFGMRIRQGPEDDGVENAEDG